MKIIKLAITFTLIYPILGQSKSTMCELLKLDPCPTSSSYRKSSSASLPTSSGGFNFNPSSIPTDKGFGLEILNFDGEQDIAIVTGTGRIGAAISPSSYEDSFFGNISYESYQKYLTRKQLGGKYKSNKMSFATAINIFNNKKSLLKSFSSNIGLIAKYNKDSKKFNWGAGLNLNISILSFGVTKYKDDYFIAADPIDFTSEDHQTYSVDTITIGVKLPHIVADYTYLRNKFEIFGFTSEDSISLLTATLFWKSFMFTYGNRKEVSVRPLYNFDTEAFEFAAEKNEMFLGVQYAINKHFILGLYNNYYLNRGYKKWG